MDCEDMYDQPSFVAFCKLLIGMGFAITFCPAFSGADYFKFWVGSLSELEKTNKGAVKWWNLQCYDGAEGNDPKVWANHITAQIREFSTDGFILASDWARFYDTNDGGWGGDCPPAVKRLISKHLRKLASAGHLSGTCTRL